MTNELVVRTVQAESQPSVLFFVWIRYSSLPTIMNWREINLQLYVWSNLRWDFYQRNLPCCVLTPHQTEPVWCRMSSRALRQSGLTDWGGWLNAHVIAGSDWNIPALFGQLTATNMVIGCRHWKECSRHKRYQHKSCFHTMAFSNFWEVKASNTTAPNSQYKPQNVWTEHGIFLELQQLHWKSNREFQQHSDLMELQSELQSGSEAKLTEHLGQRGGECLHGRNKKNVKTGYWILKPSTLQ